MFDLLANLLSFLYDINNSYVVAIVLLTLVVLIVSTPLTLKGTRSQLQMSLLQPELKAIQDKYCLLYTSPSPRDRQKSRMPSSA